MRSLRIIFIFLRQALLREMAYPGNFWFLFFTQAAGSVVQVFGIEIIFAHTTALAGWSKGESLVFLAVFGIVLGILRLFFDQSFMRFCADVHTGAFDLALVRPVDPRIALSFRGLALQQTGQILFNIGLLVWVFWSGMAETTWWAILGFALLLAMGIVVGYCLWFALTLLVFWAPAIEHFGYLYGVLVSVVRFPLDIYGRMARNMLLTLLPLGLLVTVPAEFLLGAGTVSGLVITALLTTVIFFTTQWWWRFALRHYASASS